MDFAIDGCFGPPTVTDLLLAWVVPPVVAVLATALLLLLTFGMNHTVAVIADRILDAWERLVDAGRPTT